MGMAENPDYICNPTELESTTRRGGLATFLAVYGHDEEARILLNGVVFKNREKFDEFVKFQKEKNRPVVAMQKKSGRNIWLLMIARDPEIAYTDDERRLIVKGVKQYEKRTGAKVLFNDMWPDAAPAS